LQQERRLAIEEKERLMQGMWAEKQSLLRAMSRLSETRSVDEAQLEVVSCMCVWVCTWHASVVDRFRCRLVFYVR
jgi:hypothetical protein